MKFIGLFDNLTFMAENFHLFSKTEYTKSHIFSECWTLSLWATQIPYVLGDCAYKAQQTKQQNSKQMVTHLNKIYFVVYSR